MGATASLDRTALAVEPGEQVSAELRVRNNGQVVDQFTFEGLGTAAAWISAEPDLVSLFPGAEQTVTVWFRPPRVAATAPGPTPFGVKVVSREDPDGSCVEEGVLTIGTFAERSVELFPLTARGRRSAKFELAVDNRGNAPILVDLAGSDAEDACTYRFTTTAERIEPGTARFVKLRVTPRKRFWKGPPKTHQFQVVVSERPPVIEVVPDPLAADGAWAPPDATPEESTATAASAPIAAVAVVEIPAGTEVAPVAAPEVVNGTMLQEALVPPWLIKAILIALAALLVLWILWQTLFKSTVESAARDAVEEPIAELTERVDEVAPTTAPPETTPDGNTVPTTAGQDTEGEGTEGEGTDGEGTDGEGTDGEGTGTGTTTPSFATPFGDPTDFQLGGGTTVPAGSSQTFSQPFTTQFSMTDLVFQNPAGDSGLITVSRDGAVLFTSALENFRDLDQHFVAPYTFASGQSLVMNVTCTTPGPAAAGCTVSASFAGFRK